MSDMQPSDPLLTDPWRGLFGRCPRCSEGRMFRPFLRMSDRCGLGARWRTSATRCCHPRGQNERNR